MLTDLSSMRRTSVTVNGVARTELFGRKSRQTLEKVCLEALLNIISHDTSVRDKQYTLSLSAYAHRSFEYAQN